MSRTASVLFVCSALFLPLLALAQENPELDQLRIPHKKFVLGNGLTVVVHEDHTVPIVAVNVWYHVGSRNERRGRTGFAHLFEHFFFNGSEHHPFGFREAMDDIGANNRNGTTSNDRTNFFEDVPVSALERTLFLESDRLGFLAGNLSDEMLERERGVVQNEKRQRENQPYGRVFTRVVESIYPYAHPYSWPVLGSMADLDAARLEDVKTWYETFYGPNNCVIALAGDITYESAVELMTRYFGEIPPGPPAPSYRAWVPAFERDLRDQMLDRVPQARIYRVYHAPPWGDAELTHLQLASSVLSGSRSARLDRTLIYDKQLATGVASFVWEKEISSNVIFMVTVKPGVDPAAAEAELDAILDEFMKDGPTTEELGRARMRTVAGFARGTERLGGFGGRSDVLAESMTFGDAPDAYLAQFEAMFAAGPDTVRQSTRKWIDTTHYTMTVLPEPELQIAAAPLDRSAVPELGDAPDVEFPRIQTAELKNGLKLLLLERTSVPLVNATLAIDAGYASDPAEHPGLATLALRLMEEGGTKTRDGFQIVDELDSLGAQISTSSSLDLSFVSLEALKMNLAGSLDLLADVVLAPTFPEDMVVIAKRRQLAQIDQEKARPLSAALRLAPRLLYGEDHPYSNPLTGSGYAATVESIERDDLGAWHKAWFRPTGATLIVAGDISMGELKSQVERVFGKWKRGTAPKKNIAQAPAAPARKVYLVDKPDATQSVIVAAHVTRPGGQADDLAVETVMRLFGGMSTSRLNRNLRLDKHWSYGSFALLSDARGPRPLAVVAPVQTDKTKEAMIELTGEIRGMAGERPVEGEEYESIMRNMVLRLPGRFETLSSLENAAIDMVSYGYQPEYFYDYAENVRRLSADDLNTAASRFIEPDQLTWIIIGDLTKIEPGIRELGYGELVRLDADGMPTGQGETAVARAMP